MLLAHQGGWDEFLLAASPVIAFGVMLWLANRRAQRRLDESPPDPRPATSDEAAPDTEDSSPSKQDRTTR